MGINDSEMMMPTPVDYRVVRKPDKTIPIIIAIIVIAVVVAIVLASGIIPIGKQYDDNIVVNVGQTFYVSLNESATPPDWAFMSNSAYKPYLTYLNHTSNTVNGTLCHYWFFKGNSTGVAELHFQYVYNTDVKDYWVRVKVEIVP